MVPGRILYFHWRVSCGCGCELIITITDEILVWVWVWVVGVGVGGGRKITYKVWESRNVLNTK